jgi:hypothetical protein
MGEAYTPIKVTSSVLTGQYDVNLEKQFIWFSKSPWTRAPNQLWVISFLTFSGQIVCFNPKRNGKFTNLN